MKHKLLWTMAIIGVLALVLGIVLYLGILSVPAALSTRISPAIAAIHQWIQGVTMHVTPTQLVEGAGVAWFFFVLALVLLARSGRTDSQGRESQVAVPEEAAIAGAVPPYKAHAADEVVYLPLPQLPQSYAEHEEPVEYVERTSNDSSESSTSSLATALAASDVLTRQSIASERMPLPEPESERQNRRPSQSNRGHLLALTGIAQTDGKVVPYGLFLVAEDVSTSPGTGVASRRGIEIITEQILPSLANGSALKSAQLAALLKMAVMRADLDLREQGLRTATVLETAVTGVMVVGDVAHVVNIGDCRTYLFRPSSGLVQITTAHSVISCLVDSGLLQPDAVYQHSQRDQVYRCLGGSHAATVIDVFELQVQPDDLVLLCSPEVWHALRRPQIETLLHTAPHPRSAATQLVRECARCTRDDAVNVLVVRPLGEWIPTFGVPDDRAHYP